MKIACQSCQAKYTIADEKVLGKIVKIRCKKCGATIVINGNEQEGATQALDTSQQQGGGVYDYTAGSGGESWTVNVSDGDQRTMTTAEVVDAFRTGVVNDETYCWKDGMGDWLPLREIPELSAALQAGPQPSMHAHASEAPPPADDQPTQAGFSSLFGGGGAAPAQPEAGASLFGGGGGGAAAAAPSAARRAGGRAGGADLFGSAATAGSEQDAMSSSASAAGAAGGAGSMTGQRNENSVLFSLSALTANAPKEETPMAQGEGSGLIDIRALANNMNAGNDKGPKKVDDIMNLGGGGAFSAALAAPVLAPPPADVADLSVAQAGGEPKKGNTGLIVGMIVGLLLFGGIIAGAIVYVMKPATTATTTPTTTTTATAAPTDTSTAANTGGGTTGTSTAPPGSVAAVDTSRPATTSTGGGGNHATPTNTGGNTGGTAATVAAGTATAKPTATGGGGGGKCGCAADDFQCNMACSATGTKPTATATAAANTSSAPFDKGAALSSLSGIASNLSSCKKPDGPTGSGKVTVTFEPSGNVSKVEFIEGPFGGTAVGGCIAGKFRGAHIPPFAGSAVPANKSFVLN